MYKLKKILKDGIPVIMVSAGFKNICIETVFFRNGKNAENG
jgi:hypothetical protein